MATEARARGRARRDARALRPKRWPVARKLLGIGAAGAVLVPATIAARAVAPGSRPRVPSLFHKLTCQTMGIQVRVTGARHRRGGVLYVSNHLSWADIPVLGSKLLASFVSKSEVGGWGVIGYLSRLQDTIYVDRARRQDTATQRDAIASRLAAGGRVILFAEGTNSDGVHVLPFKSSLFSVIEQPDVEHVLIQPVTLAYTRVNGMPVTRGLLPSLAWVGDVALKPHIADFMRLGKVRAEILLHEPVRRADFKSRKELARHCQEVVAAGYAKLMRGETGVAPSDRAFESNLRHARGDASKEAA